MKKIKVLHLPLYQDRGGINSYVLTLWNKIDPNHFHFDFLTFSKKLDCEDEILRKGSRLYYVSAKAEEDQVVFTEEIKEIFKNGYDIVHIHTSFWQSYLLEEIARDCGIKRIVIHAHNSGIPSSVKKELRQQKEEKHNAIKDDISKKWATDFWACSQEAANWIFGKNVDRRDIKILNNAIDINKYIYNEKKRKAFRKENNWEDKFLIGFVGRLAHQKNIPFLCKMFYEVHKIRKNAHLVLVGEGKLEKDAVDYFQEKGIKNHVDFLGFRDDVHDILNGLDVFCLPSHFEGFPIVLVEAQINGLRCIVSKNVTKEVNIDGLVMFEDLDVSQWARGLQSIKKGYSRKIDRHKYFFYDIENEAKKVEKMYKYVEFDEFMRDNIL